MLNTKQIAQQLVSLLKEKKFLEAQSQLFTQDASSHEPKPFSDRSACGLTAIMQKEELFLASIKEWKTFEITKPIISNDHFSIGMKANLILKNDREVSLDEIIVYQVEEGKIANEFFYYQ